ncbi:MAG: hypothetical protein VW268_10790 [Rhodospirillaceae bacterium]
MAIPISKYLYGTAWKEERTESLTTLAIEQGFRGVDTANQRTNYYEAADPAIPLRLESFRTLKIKSGAAARTVGGVNGLFGWPRMECAHGKGGGSEETKL